MTHNYIQVKKGPSLQTFNLFSTVFPLTFLLLHSPSHVAMFVHLTSLGLYGSHFATSVSSRPARAESESLAQTRSSPRKTHKLQIVTYLGPTWRRCPCPAGFCRDTMEENSQRENHLWRTYGSGYA